ncbi:MAG TPA: hypothetical protein VFE88_04635 [Candidatus Nanoarchaeia archaeon]|nr:hypothetical protein [Candidatus Nanoarchaeia archaeon]
MGFPQQHVDEIMGKVLEKLGNEQGVVLVRKAAVAAEKVKQEMFSAFAEVDVELADLGKLNYFCFHYLPSSVEILDVERIELSSVEFTHYLNDVLATIHEYNMIVANLRAENKILKEKMNASEVMT